MTTGAKIGIAVGILALGFGALVIYKRWSFPKMVSKSGKKITVRYKGKDSVVDAQDLSGKGVEFSFGGNSDWALKPAYANESDKSSLYGLHLTDMKGAIHNTFRF